jgi:hypothetical protein
MVASVIGPIIGGALSLFGASQAASAAESAAGTQVEAARVAAELGREAIGFSKEVFNVGRADLAPYRASGGAALRTLNDLFIPGGQSVVQLQGRLNELRAEKARLMSGVNGTASPVQQAAVGAAGVGTALSSIGNGSGDEARERNLALTQARLNAPSPALTTEQIRESNRESGAFDRDRDRDDSSRADRETTSEPGGIGGV